MANNLEYLIELARKYRHQHVLTEEERQRQIRSFAFGNTHFENESITKSDIDRAMDSLRADSDHAVCS